MVVHKLKTWPEPFKATWNEEKRYEFRVNDRDFEVGHRLRLCEWDPEREKYTGSELIVQITYLQRGPDFGIPVGFVVLSLSVILEWKD